MAASYSILFPFYSNTAEINIFLKPPEISPFLQIYHSINHHNMYLCVYIYLLTRATLISISRMDSILIYIYFLSNIINSYCYPLSQIPLSNSFGNSASMAYIIITIILNYPLNHENEEHLVMHNSLEVTLLILYHILLYYIYDTPIQTGF